MAVYFKHCFLLILLGICCQPARAQLYSTQYRPPNQRWQYLATPHFKIVYSKGNDSTALKMGRILETQYPKAQNLVGGSLHKFPVILNDYNDRSNGFVTSLNFRSEIELSPTVGKVLNPQNGNWLANVGPHELVHALQFSHLGSNNFPRLVNLFSPDLARSLHGAIPSGMLEGIAVYGESTNVKAHGGRGNFPMFTNQFNAVFDSGARWSMGQMLQTSTWTRPFDRHYIGGYEFTNWLQKTYGPATTRKALSFYMDYPFLGYGIALRHVTGRWPGQLYRRLENEKEKALKSVHADSTPVQELKIPYHGREIRRPQWRSDSTLIFYGSFYNARAGFYCYNLNNHSLKRLVTTNTVRDYRYDLSKDHAKMVYSYYRASTLYDNTAKAELGSYNFETQKTQSITKNGRLYAPFFTNDKKLYALQTKPASSRLVSVDDRKKSTNDFTHILSLGSYEITAVAPNPVNNTWAVVANKGGMQALWISPKGRLDSALAQPPALSFDEGSVFDPQWHPDGNKLLFSSGFSGTHQIYEYNLQDRIVTQITDAPYNAFEGSYSPDGNRIAFIKQVKNEKLPAILYRANFLNQPVASNKWKISLSDTASAQRSVIADSVVEASKNWKSAHYSSGLSWLKPRTFLPVFNEVSNRDIYETGLSLQSGNLLSNQTYSAEATFLEDRLWYDLLYKNTSFFPGFETRLYNRPSYLSYRLQTPEGPLTKTLLRQERSLALSMPFTFRLNRNIYNTSLLLKPQIRRSQMRLLNIGPSNITSGFANHAVTNIYTQFNFRIQQNSRDLQPNSGLIFYSEVEHYLSTDEISFTQDRKTTSVLLDHLTALRGGLYTYLSPLRKWNQSLRLGVRGLTQSGPVFDNQSLVSEAFSEPVLPNASNSISLSTRYTIPLTYTDNGGFLLPFYLSNIYLVAFSNSVTDPASKDWIDSSRSVFGVGIRARFRLSNLAFDLGVGLGYEPTRGNTQVFVGDF